MTMNTQQGNIITRLADMARRTVRVFMSPKTPWYVKMVLAAGLIYILSPYDLIPDWVPVLGIMDDIALAAILIAWAAGYQED